MPHPTASTDNRSRLLAQELGRAIQRGRWAIGQTLPTTRQIAREQGMSLATVQVGLRELEAAGLVERKPRQGVVVKSRVASGWSGGGSVQQIGIITRIPPRDGGDSWSYRISRAAETVASRYRLNPVLLPQEHDSDGIQTVLDRIGSNRQAMVGVIAFNGGIVSRLIPAMDRIDMPWVIINRYDARTIHNFVAADNLLGCRLVGECFARMELRRVLVLMAMGVDYSEAEKEMVSGLLQGFLGMGEPINGIDYILCGESDSSRGRVARYLHEHETPQVIFALDDAMASGAIAACVEAGLSVPDQVKIVGGAGLDLSLHTRPTLSVIAQPMAEMGRQAAEMLLEMVQHGQRRIGRRRITGRFILRESLSVPADILAALEKKYPGMIE